LLEELIQQEQTVSSSLGKDIALPHARLKMRRPYLLLVGRLKKPIKGSFEIHHKETRLVVLLLASAREPSYLNTLAGLAKVLQGWTPTQDFGKIPLDKLRQEFTLALRGTVAVPTKNTDRFNRLILREAVKIAHAGKCSAILLFADTLDAPIDAPFANDFPLKKITVTHRAVEMTQEKDIYILPVQLFSLTRLSQLRSAILLALMHNVLHHNEKVCCIGGIPHSNRLDTILVVDVHREVQSIFSRQTDILPKSVRPEVFERLLAIATELAVEGREGNSVGCLFVLGDPKELKPFVKPLVLNPFFGYKEEDRSLLNPFIDETIKEYSLLDGAFVISGNGVLESAGSLIRAADTENLPGGLGTRHAAAMAISKSIDCIALTVSASTGQVTLFRKGKMLPLIEKGIGNSALNVTLPIYSG
jgi:DNA integrity scanning protein DisA with diadenylate cyclase activity